MKYSLQKYCSLVIIILSVNTQYLFSQCDVIFPQIEMDSGQYASWEEGNRSILNEYYYHGMSIVGNNQATLTNEAESSLSHMISTTIQSDMRIHYKEDKYDILINTIEQNIESFSKTTIKDYNKIVVNYPGQGIRAHVFKCKDDVERERDEHNRELSEKINNYKKKYEKHFRDQEYSEGFKDMCIAYLYISSVSDIGIYDDYLEDYIEVKGKLEIFLQDVDIILGDHKNISTVRAVPLPKSNRIIKLTARYSEDDNRYHALEKFKILSEISEVSDWDNNIEEVIFNTSGKAELEIPIIYSGEKAIVSFIPVVDIPDISLIKEGSRIKLEEIFKTFFTKKQDKVTIKIRKGNLKVQYSETKPEHFRCNDKGYRSSFMRKISESFGWDDDKIEIENLVSNPKLSIVIRKKNNGGYNFTARILIDDNELAENSKFLDSGPNLTSNFCNSLIQELYKGVTQASIEGKLAKDVSIEIFNDQKGVSHIVSYDKKREGLFELILEKDKWKITLHKNRESSKDTMEIYLNRPINISSRFKNGFIDLPPPKEVMVSVSISNTQIKHDIVFTLNDIVLKWDGKRKEWKGEGEGFGQFRGVEGKKHRLILRKDGWEVHKGAHKIKDYGHKIDVRMEKIELNLPRNFGYSLVPGSLQVNWYKTNLFKQMFGIALGLGTIHLMNETYKSDQDYRALKQEYKSSKMIYESLAWADNQTEFDINYQNTQTAYNAMESSYDQRKYNMIGLGSVYLFNLGHLLYINYNF